MPTSNELIEELVSLTRGSLRSVETDHAELRADVRVLEERVNNQASNTQRLEGDLTSLKTSIDASLSKGFDDQDKLLIGHKKSLDAAISAVKNAAKEELAEYKKANDELVKKQEERINKLEQAHAKYLGAAAVAGAVLGFIASLAKGALGL